MPLDASGNVFAPPAVPNSGPTPGPASFPSGSFRIRSVCLMHRINARLDASDMSYAYAGHWSPTGDQITPYLPGSGFVCKDFPADAPVFFEPGEYLDVHAACTGPGTHWVTLQVWYTDR